MTLVLAVFRVELVVDDRRGRHRPQNNANFIDRRVPSPLVAGIKLAVFDMDGVIIRNTNSWRAVHEAFGTSNEEGLRLFMSGKIDDHEFIRRDVELWKGAKGKLHHDDVAKVLSTFHPEPAAADVFGAFHRAGITTAIVSGGLEPLARRIGEALSVDRVFCNGLEVDQEGYLTGHGKVGVPLRGKGDLVVKLRDGLGLARSDVVAFGDTSIDIPMFRESGFGIAVDPKDEETRKAASIIVPDLGSAIPIVNDLLNRDQAT
jgi:phosphoserine phosphatase